MKIMDRAQVLEQMNGLISKQVELEEQITTYKTYIKSLRQELKEYQAEIRDIHAKLESGQLTMGG